MRTWLGVLLGGVIAACANQVIVDDVADDGGGGPDATINKDASPKDGGTDSGADTGGGVDAGDDAGEGEDAGDDGGTVIIDAGSLDGSPCPPCLVKGYVCCANAKSKNYGTCQSSACLSCCM